VGSLHWLILIPYYFFAALTTLLLLTVLSRLLRVRAGANRLVMIAIGLSLISVITPLLIGVADITDYEGKGFVALALASFLLAGIDTLLAPRLSMPFDEELQNL
jgi:hypothetical protein